MLTLWKFPLQETDYQTVQVPMHSCFRHVGSDPKGQLCVWAEVDTDNPLHPVEFAIVGTGNPISVGFHYLGTTNRGPYVWHLYVRIVV